MTTKLFEQLSNDLVNLLDNGDGHNIIIEVGEAPNNQTFKAHSIILSSRCSYFRKLSTVTYNENNIPIIKKPEISIEVFDIIIRYIYSGIIFLENVDSSTIFDLLIVANDFGLEELVMHIQLHIIETDASKNFNRIYQISINNENFKTLQQFCAEIIANYPSFIFDSDDFFSFPESALISLLERDDLQMDEGKIWDHVIRWGIAQNPDLSSEVNNWSNEDFMLLRETLQYCLPHIRYFHISGEDVVNKIKPYRKILDRDLWVDIKTNNIAPNVPISSRVLPRRDVLTATSSFQNSLTITPTVQPFTLTSNVITKDDSALISSWIDYRTTYYDTTNIPYHFKLILRGSQDGFTPEVFQNLCDGLCNTVVVLRVQRTKEILGGYNPLAWKKPVAVTGAEYEETEDSFIFSLRNSYSNNPVLSRVENSIFAIRYHRNCGPIFGDNDLFMHMNVKNETKWHCNQRQYEKPIRCTDNFFDIEEYEVFQICKKQ